MNLEAIASDLSAALTGAPSLGVRVYPTIVGTHQLPAAVLSVPEEVTYNRTFKGGASVVFDLWLLVPLTDVAQAVMRCYRFMSTEGDLSIPSRLNGRTSAHWTALKVESAGRPTEVQIGATGKCLGVAFRLTMQGV